MPSYIHKLKWNDQTSKELGLICDVRFDGDVGETDSYLSREAVISETYNGVKRYIHGYKYSDVLQPSITFMKSDFQEFSYAENRQILSWLTGKRMPSYLEIYEEAMVFKYCLFGNFTQIEQYKQDSKVIGYIATFESDSPFAYSDIVSYTLDIAGHETVELYNRGDEYADVVYPVIEFTQNDDIFFHVDELPEATEAITDTVYVTPDSSYHARIEGDTWSAVTILSGNISDTSPSAALYGKYYYCKSDGCIYYCDTRIVNEISQYYWKLISSNVWGTLEITNVTTNQTTIVKSIKKTEKITLDGSNKIIGTTWENKIFGDAFNWNWFALSNGKNQINISGNGEINIRYRYPIKCGDM